MSAPTAVTFEHLREALGVGTATPRLSWQLPDGFGHQSSYQLELHRDDGIHRSDRAGTDRHLLVDWPGPPLTSRERVGVRVRVWDSDDRSTPWSEPAWVEAGLLTPTDWQAVPVGAGWPEHPGTDRRPALVRREFTLRRPITRARLYVSAHGLFEAEVNGNRVGADALGPGWTVYGHRLRYYTYDVTDLLVTGSNVLGAWLGDGWYRGRIGFDGGARDLYGTDQALIAQLETHHDDGSTTVVATDSSWLAAPSPILTSGLYEGEVFDARLHDPHWSTSGGGRSRDWQPVTVGNRDRTTLVAPSGPAVRCTEQRHPAGVETTPDGRYLLDFGQNLVGRLRITVTGPAGTTVRLRHAEVLQDGELATGPLREAHATDEYTLAGHDTETWEPRFTLHGFRYAEVSGWPGELTPDAVTALVYHSDMRRTGWFSCSDERINRLHENVVWSMRGNFVDLPTDCPARDERLGWTGDLQIFAPTAAFLYDCAGLLDSWLTDVAVEQLPDGTVPWYVPVVPGGPIWTPIRPGAAWGDAVALTPWLLYERYGNMDLLRRHYPAGKAWVDLIERLAGPDRLWDSGFQLGDWLDPAAPPDDPAAGRTDPYLVATAYFARSAQRIAASAAVLGLDRDARHYATLAAEVTTAFQRRFVTAPGRLTSDSPTAYALAIAFDLLDGDDRTAAGGRLADLVRADDHRIATGFVGTPVICDALSSTGHLDTAYRLLTQTQCPSWLYPVTMGATTMWERWDSLRPDGTLNPGGMTSFNHYALGAVADWLHRVVAGLDSESPGYGHLLFRPRPGGGLTWAHARHETPYGLAEVSWRLADGLLHTEVTVPAGSKATVHLPGRDPFAVGAGRHTFTTEAPVPARP